MMLQPLADLLRITRHGRAWRIVHVSEDGIKYGAGTLHEPVDMLVGLAVNVRQEEKLLVSRP